MFCNIVYWDTETMIACYFALNGESVFREFTWEEFFEAFPELAE